MEFLPSIKLTPAQKIVIAYLMLGEAIHSYQEEGSHEDDLIGRLLDVKDAFESFAEEHQFRYDRL